MGGVGSSPRRPHQQRGNTVNIQVVYRDGRRQRPGTAISGVHKGFVMVRFVGGGREMVRASELTRADGQAL